MICGARLFLLGRLSAPDAALRSRVEAMGGVICPRSSKAVTHTVLAHASARAWTSRRRAGVLLSEHSFLRALGLRPPMEATGNSFTTGDLARHAGLERERIGQLALFDVVDAVDGTFGFRDLACAREAARLLRCGIPFSEILAAGATLRDRGIRISEVRMCTASAGKVAIGGGEHFFEPDGQYALDLSESRYDIDAVLARAEAAETEEDWPGAEQLYRLAAYLDPACPEITFNLANMLREQGRADEAIAAYLGALKRDPAMADAWYNLALVRSGRGQPVEAERCYRAALSAEPHHPDALFNLALLMTRAARYEEALPLWERLGGLKQSKGDPGTARRAALLCRLELGRTTCDGASAQAGSVLRRAFAAAEST